METCSLLESVRWGEQDEPGAPWPEQHRGLIRGRPCVGFLLLFWVTYRNFTSVYTSQSNSFTHLIMHLFCTKQSARGWNPKIKNTHTCPQKSPPGRKYHIHDFNPLWRWNVYELLWALSGKEGFAETNPKQYETKMKSELIPRVQRKCFKTIKPSSI